MPGPYKEETSQYRTLRINNGLVDAINEKGEINFDYSLYRIMWNKRL